MSSFSQWQKSFSATPKAKQVTWICGEERILVQDVADSLVKLLNPPSWGFVSMTAGEDSERDIWAEAEQFSLDSFSKHVVVIQSAEKLKKWNRLQRWVETRLENPRTFLILVSNEDTLPRIEMEVDGEKKKVLADHLRDIAPKISTVECRPFTQATAPHAVTWVQSKVKMRTGVAGYLLDRANGDLRLVRDVCQKLSVFQDDIVSSTIDLMLTERPAETFVNALMMKDKRTALLALQRVPQDRYSYLVGSLDEAVDLAGIVHDLQVARRTQGEITKAVGNKGFLVKDVIGYAKHYDAKRRMEIRQVLAMADEALRGGAFVGVPESIVAFW